MPWVEVVQVGVEAVDWLSDGDEWFHRISECVPETEGYSVTGHKFDLTTEPFISITGTGPSGALDTRLLVLPLERGILIAIGCEEESLDALAADAWVRAARCATERLGTSGPAHEWTALVGPPPVRIGGAEPYLEGEHTIGPFRIRTAGPALREIVPPQQPLLGGAGFATSWPLLVAGSQAGYNWEAVSRKVAFELHRLTALLSLAFGECVVVRESPAPESWGPRHVPDRLWWHDWPEGSEQEPPQARNLISLPEWVPDAWESMQARPSLAAAAVAHHEGLRAQMEHPSLALVAFIASIETIANALFTAERCPQCRGHRNISARFRATLRMVTDDETAVRLGKAYSPRSRTVHEGQLHGSETTPGSFGLMWNDPARDFEWNVLYAMRIASRDLLRRALLELPEEPIPFDTDDPTGGAQFNQSP